jgi:hypothetical protein
MQTLLTDEEQARWAQLVEAKTAAEAEIRNIERAMEDTFGTALLRSIEQHRWIVDPTSNPYLRMTPGNREAERLLVDVVSSMKRLDWHDAVVIERDAYAVIFRVDDGVPSLELYLHRANADKLKGWKIVGLHVDIDLREWLDQCRRDAIAQTERDITKLRYRLSRLQEGGPMDEFPEDEFPE